MSHIKNVNNCQGNITRPDNIWLIIVSGIELHYPKYDTHLPMYFVAVKIMLNGINVNKVFLKLGFYVMI